MALGADDYIGVIPFHMLDKHRDAVRVDLHTRIDKGDIIAFGIVHTEANGEALALIILIAEDFDFRDMGFFQFFEGVVDFPVDDDDDLVVVADLVKDFFYLGDIFDNNFLLSVSRYDKAQKMVVFFGSDHVVWAN